jgi:hypothetical protein
MRMSGEWRDMHELYARIQRILSNIGIIPTAIDLKADQTFNTVRASSCFVRDNSGVVTALTLLVSDLHAMSDDIRSKCSAILYKRRNRYCRFLRIPTNSTEWEFLVYANGNRMIATEIKFIHFN